MNREEQQLIEDLFARLRNFGGAGGKDPDAQALISDLIRRSPDAPYYLAQTVIIQQQALERAEARMSELEEAASRPQQSASRGGSFLSGGSVPSAGGRFGSETPQQRMAEPASVPSGPWSSQARAGGGAGGFLSSALTTAAGVAGGVFLADGIRSLFGGGNSAYASGGTSDQSTIDRLQDEAQDARDDADQDKKDLAADDAELDRMQDAQDDDDDAWTDDDSMDV
ncbi:DUF2076 domain-containing protein [Hyphomicrobium sp.]|jgi:hypothetical protein|uniref:DUF2076 domain-containing protein n=1 Tax=Hyphomicrobium sp. TaxID=82 RepID=UPI003561AAF2